MDFQLYQSVVTCFPLGIGRFSPEYLILDFNIAVEHFLGRRIAELRGQLLGSALLRAVRNTITLSKTPTIQIVEGHRELAYLPQQFLYDKEFEVLLACDGCDGLDEFREYHPDPLILDVRMPRMDSMETCRRIRETSDVPIVVLTCTAHEMDKVRGLTLGPDDYVTKPFSKHQLVARVWAVRRVATVCKLSSTIDVDDRLSIDPAAGQVWPDGKRVSLSATEYRLLSCLIYNSSHRILNRLLTILLPGFNQLRIYCPLTLARSLLRL